MRSAKFRNVIWQVMVVLHRYLGVAVGLLMVMWFASGIIMMYVGFPRITQEERARTLEPVAWQDCCRVPQRLAPDEAQIFGTQIENVAGVPVMRLRPAARAPFALDLERGAVIRIDAEAAQEIALDAAPRIIGRPASVAAAEEIQSDQWTLGRLGRERPLYRVAFDDPERTSIYVSGSNAQVVLWTTATERFLSWIGAIPHWLYFAELRSNPVLWTEIVIWTSVLGTFLTVLGLYLGITQFKARTGFSPYRGWLYWHHIVGLVFGVATLTFVVSGLISMNPWGFLEDERSGGEEAQLEGRLLNWGELRTSLEAIRAKAEVAGAVSLVTAPFAGRLYWLATRQDGSVTRLDAEGIIAPVSEADLLEAAKRIAGDVEIAEQALIGEEDAYYFRQGGRFVLPVYRVVLRDDENTRYYLDPRTGALLQRTDATARWYRWLFNGFHRIDFAAWMRARPAWDIIVLTLMLGGLASTVTGFYLAIRRIRHDVMLLFRFVARRKGAIAQKSAGVAGLVIAVAIMTASGARAQASSDSVYTLTTFDVSPSATPATIALLKQYRDAARKQDGNIGVDLLQERGLSNRFAIHESWRSRSAFDANEKASQMAALRDGLKPLAGGPLDRRTYRPFSIGPSRNAASGSAVYMLLFLDVFPPGLVPTLAAVKDAAMAARKGEGNLRYDVEQEGLGLGNHMIFYAAWQNRDDFDSYEKSDYARHLRDVVGPLLGSPYDDRLYALLD